MTKMIKLSLLLNHLTVPQLYAFAYNYPNETIEINDGAAEWVILQIANNRGMVKNESTHNH